MLDLLVLDPLDRGREERRVKEERLEEEIRGPGHGLAGEQSHGRSERVSGEPNVGVSDGGDHVSHGPHRGLEPRGPVEAVLEEVKVELDVPRERSGLRQSSPERNHESRASLERTRAVVV